MVTVNQTGAGEAPVEDGSRRTGKQAKVTARAFLIGLLAGATVCAVGPYNDYYVGATFLSGNFFPIMGVSAILLLTLLINPLLISLNRRNAIFTASEIITVWTMIVVVAGIPGSGMMRLLVPHIVAPLYYSTPDNRWDDAIVSHLNHRLIVTDPNAVKWFFEGLPRDKSIPWGAWLEPMAWWAMFAGLMYVVFFSLSAIVRKQWVENDHLTFPLVKLPVLLSDEPEAGRHLPVVLRNPLLWIAVGLCTVLHTVKGMHLFYPTIPDVTTSISSSQFLTSPPYSYLNNMNFAVFPLVIGFSYFLSNEVSLSLWLFYVIGRVQNLIAGVNAWDIHGAKAGICMGPAFEAYQEAGAAVMIAIWIVWSMRLHIKDVVLKALGRSDVDDTNEPLGYRNALIGFLAGYAGLFAWLTGVAHMAPLMAVGVLLGSFVVFITLSWLVAQAGLLFAQMAFAPSQITCELSAGSAFGANTLFMSSFVEHVGWFDAREMMMPSIMNAEKAASSVSLNQRSLFKALGIAVAVAFVVAAVSSIWLPYSHGGGAALSDRWGYIYAPQDPFKWAMTALRSHDNVAGSIIQNMTGGAAFVMLLMILRSSIAAFPIHPAGFLVAATYPMAMLWFSLLLGWIIKAPIVRYLGVNGHNKLMPFFLGLILGDCMNAVIWTVIGLITHTGYRLLPG